MNEREQLHDYWYTVVSPNMRILVCAQTISIQGKRNECTVETSHVHNKSLTVMKEKTHLEAMEHVCKHG